MMKQNPQRRSPSTVPPTLELESKLAHKLELQQSLGWPEESKRMLLCIPTALTDALGANLLTETLPGLLTLPLQIVILGKGSSSYGKLLTDLSKEHPQKIGIIPSTDEAIQQMYRAADASLFLCDTSDLSELSMSLRHGAVPIALSSRDLKNYDPNQESGTAFLYDQLNTWQCFAAVVRAMETYKFPFDWRTIQRHCVESV